MSGVIGIIWVFRYDLSITFYFVVAAGIFDFLDGFLARILKVQSPIGKQLDSLADLVSFGVLPSIFLYQYLEIIAPNSAFNYLSILIAAFSALRLAIFNLDDSQSDKFIGLPTPANAIAILSITFLDFSIPAWSIYAGIILLSYLLVSNINLIALKFQTFKWSGNEFRILLIISVITSIAILGIPALTFAVPLYVVFSLIQSAFSKRNS